MKRTILTFAILVFCFSAKINAQNPVATLEHGQQTMVYYGINALVEANTAAVNGDTVYLSTGSFTGITINKMLIVIGAGHYPDSVNLNLRTIVTSINFGQGSDNSKIVGLFISGNVEFATDKHLTKIEVSRCSLQDYKFNSNAQTASKDFCSVEQSVIRGNVYCSNYCNNFFIKNCIVNGSIRDVNGNCCLVNNIFLKNNNDLFYNLNGSLLQNNVIIGAYVFYNSNSNSLSNNIFISSNIGFVTNFSQNNWFGIPQSTLFVTQSGNVFDYSHNYHLKEPAKYIGSDSMQVGIYGGDTPYKEKALPANPHVVSKKIPFKTDPDGNLQINMTIKAQEN